MAQRLSPVRGIALIAVLLAVALATVVVLEAVWRGRLGLRRVENLQLALKAHLLAEQGIEAGKQMLTMDMETSRLDHLKEPWAQPYGPYAVEGGQVDVAITALDGRLNLNNATDPEFAAILVTLYRHVGLDPRLVKVLADGIDADDEGLGYRNRPLERLEELASLPGYDPDLVRRLAPWVAVLPGHTLLNLNVAPPEVLASLHPDLGQEQVRALLKARPFHTVQDALALPELGAVSLPVRWLTTVSRYFEIAARGKVGRVLVPLRVLLDRGTRPMAVLAWREP